ncbi:hypothetical protein HPB48_020936 [Haemaphysalis longicornis]|uniref:Uncharacterized protein n=1 Tax=Haemaphysalis longicornis TaxID=44386 RepID=A0A9J6G0M9_HAELO|nr:hypothetical protein HPB48_020936 [Haemaphysalis longicornis]
MSVTLKELGNITNKTVTSAEWLRMIRLYTNQTYNASHYMICWDNGPLVMQHMIDSAGIGTNDSRLLIGWSLLRRLMHLASGSLMAKMYPLKIEDFCFETALGVMEVAVMNVYFKKYLPESALKKAERMAKLIHEQLKIKMNQTTWIKGDFRSLVSEKAAKLGVYVGYPPNLAAPGSIDRYFAPVAEEPASCVHTLSEVNFPVLRRAEVEAEARVQFPRLSHRYDSEGFVDWTGLWLAYYAYRALSPDERDAVIPGLPLTAEQLFFVAHCYKWCGSSRRRDPNGAYWATRSRCSLPLRQMAEFATAFNCRPGDRMNPSSRCTFFT